MWWFASRRPPPSQGRNWRRFSRSLSLSWSQYSLSYVARLFLIMPLSEVEPSSSPASVALPLPAAELDRAPSPLWPLLILEEEAVPRSTWISKLSPWAAEPRSPGTPSRWTWQFLQVDRPEVHRCLPGRRMWFSPPYFTAAEWAADHFVEWILGRSAGSGA